MQIVGVVVLVLLVLSVPIGIALSAAAAAYIAVDPLLEPTVIFRAFFNFIGRYSLIAIPLFIFAGFLMERTGLVAQLFRCEHPWNCPHGRPTVARVPRARFEEWFLRRI